jgi:hypothetical protein
MKRAIGCALLAGAAALWGTVPAAQTSSVHQRIAAAVGRYAHAMLCRDVVARVLSEKVADGYWTEAEALAFARAILRENAIRIFKLGRQPRQADLTRSPRSG